MCNEHENKMNDKELLLKYHRFLKENLNMDLHEIWVDEFLEPDKCLNCGDPIDDKYDMKVCSLSCYTIMKYD